MWSSSRNNNYFEARTLVWWHGQQLRQQKWWRFCLCLSGPREKREAPTRIGMRVNGVRIGVASDHKMVMADNIWMFFFSILFPISMGYFFSSSSSSHCCYYYYYHIVSLSMKIALSFDVFVWKECFQQWYILSSLASTQYLLVHISYAITWTHSIKMKCEKSGHSAFFSILSFICRSLFCFVLFYLRITIQTLHDIKVFVCVWVFCICV